jgi:hypothetical protein
VVDERILYQEDPVKIRLLSLVRDTIDPELKAVSYDLGLHQENPEKKNLSSIWRRQAAKLEITCRSAANDCQTLIDITAGRNPENISDRLFDL